MTKTEEEFKKMVEEFGENNLKTAMENNEKIREKVFSMQQKVVFEKLAEQEEKTGIDVAFLASTIADEVMSELYQALPQIMAATIKQLVEENE